MSEFDKLTNRTATGSYKWDVKENELPMWVADMDFQTAPAIIEALQKRAAHGIFGYNIVTDDFFASYQDWWLKRHDFLVKKEWMIFCTGVVPAISSIVRKMTTVGENVLIQSPVYNIFYNSIVNNGRNVLSSDLEYRDGGYHINFDDLEEKLAMKQTTLMILCNPHNPIGKIWDIETLRMIGDLCAKHHVLVVSDEIHCDITTPHKKYTPFASVSETNLNNSITLIAPTKAFNLAGLQTSCIVVADEYIRHKVNRGINTDEVAEPNSFAVTATVAAFEQGGEWLKEMNWYVASNKELAISFIEKNLPEIQVVKSEATYLMWLDCSNITTDSENLVEFIQEHTGLILSSGQEYGPNGAGFVRMNVACARERLVDGLGRLEKGIKDFKTE